MELKGAVVVITGSSRGFGKCLAELCAERGATVVISARASDELTKTAEELGVTAIPADVTREEDMRALAGEVVKRFGRIDIWINNAGIWYPHGLVEDADMAAAHDVFEVNVFGTIYGSRAALSHLKKRGTGIIVNIVSSSGLTGRPRSSLYASSKWAARGFTDSLREEERETGITVIGIYPGGMRTHLFDAGTETDFSAYMDPMEVAKKVVDNLAAEHPLEEQILLRPKTAGR